MIDWTQMHADERRFYKICINPRKSASYLECK